MVEFETDEELAERAARGDRVSREQLARRWWPRLRKLALLALGDRELAEEGSQNALIEVLNHLDRYDSSRPFGPWARTLARRQFAQIRRQQVRHLHEPLDTEIGTPAPDHVGRLHAQAQAQRARQAFDQLTGQQREIWHLVTQQGLSAAEAGRELGIAESTARVHLHRARRHLRAALGEP